ncbi:MAG: ABC transporter substrate-binding protein [Christensenellales bacterium]|jgi:oligopeptide transport system substrate-binding protein
MKKLLSLLLSVMMLLSVASVAGAAEITDLNTYEISSAEVETWNVHYSQAARDLNVLCNLVDGLLTNDNKGALVPNAAKEYSSPDGGTTWVFTLNEGMKWVDYQGNEKADVVAEDWLWGLEWVLNFAKNDSYNVSMPAEMIVGAQEYYDYTKALAYGIEPGTELPEGAALSEEGVAAAKALGLEKFLEMVEIKVEGNQIIYTCLAPLPYFPSVATYNCLYPVSGKFLEEVGVDGYRAVTWDTLWYSGPYVISQYVHQNEKVFSPTPNYWNADGVKRFNSVTVKMVEDANKAFSLFETGELDHVTLAQSQLDTIYKNPSDPWHEYLSESRPTKYSYQFHWVYDVKNEDGSPDDNWNKAIANLAFRQSILYGLDLTTYLARTNAINPYSCLNYAYTGNGVSVNSQGVDYTQLVRNELGYDYDGFESYNRRNPEKAAELKKQAMEELTALGVTFPVELKYYIKGDNQVAKDTADVLTQMFADYMGEDYIKFTTKTYVSNLTTEVRKPQLACLLISGWGADFADPINFLGQETYGDPQAYFANHHSMINKATDEKLIADYKEFTRLVEEAKVIYDDIDARYAAFAKAEAFMIEHALVMPVFYNIVWQLTSINPYSQVYSSYGMQGYRYVNWETNSDVYKTVEVEAFANEYNK